MNTDYHERRFIDGSPILDDYVDKLHDLIGKACDEDPGEQGEIDCSGQSNIEEIRKLEREGWRLCAGCRENITCSYCPIETRKTMGLPPGFRDIVSL